MDSGEGVDDITKSGQIYDRSRRRAFHEFYRMQAISLVSIPFTRRDGFIVICAKTPIKISIGTFEYLEFHTRNR